MISETESMDVDMEVIRTAQVEEEERLKLLAIFPEEIWLKIFDSADPDDLICWAAASPFLNELLEPRRITYLFPEVLKILHQQNYLTKRNCLDLVKLRVTCKKWKLAVDTLLENSSQLKNLQRFDQTRHKRNASLAHPIYLKLYKPSIWEKVESQILPVISRESVQENNPFPSRCIDIFEGTSLRRRVDDEPIVRFVPRFHDRDAVADLRFPPAPADILARQAPADIRARQAPFDNFERQAEVDFHARRFAPEFRAQPVAPDYRSYRPITLEFLRMAGHHFWYAHLALLEFTSPMEWFIYICKYVELMPNLKALYIQCPVFGDRQVAQFRNLPPFPTLKHLELVSVANALNSAVNAILATNMTVKALFIPSIQRLLPPPLPHAIVPTPAYSLVDLMPQEQLNFSSLQDPHTLSCSPISQKEFHDIPTQWKLQLLRLDLENCADLKDWSFIFKKLECYKLTLTQLFIHLPKATTSTEELMSWETSLSALHLPFLKKLEVTVDNMCSLDFLLGLMSLQYLVLDINHQETSPPERGTKQEKINFNYGFRNRFQECNIWDLIPTLKKADLKDGGIVKSFQRRGNNVVRVWRVIAAHSSNI